MQNFFNLKLYKEGLKKIRLVGIIAGIVMILANAIIPIAYLVNADTETTQTVIQMNEFAVPSILLLFLTPFFFLSMFSYLNKRNESDFYHAIPYKRSCVLFSFLTAIFTWIWGVLLVSLLVTGGLWALCPHTTVAFSAIPKLFGIYAFSSLYVGGFILLGMTLTGTIVSNIALSGVLLLFVRVIASLLSVVLGELIPLFDIAYSPMRIFSVRYWLPAALIQSIYDTSVFTQAGLWVYSIVVTLALYVLASVLYCRRKSESANKSAPSKRLQHLYRCAFTIPFALLTTIGIVYREMDAFVILALLAVAVYFLYELITTKNLRSTGRCAPFLIIPILCTALFTGGCYLIRGAVLENAYKPEEIQSIRSYRYASMFDLFDEESGVYENVVTQSITIQDQEAIQIVSDSLQKNIQDIKNNRYEYYRGDVEQYIEITLQSGRKVGRMIRFSEENYAKLQDRKTASKEFLEAYISIPRYEDIQNLYIDYSANVSPEELKTLWGLFTEEYQALSTEEKLAFKKGIHGQDSWDSVSGPYSEFSLNIRGHGLTNSASFTFSYEIPASFVRTRSYYNTLMQKNRDGIREEINRLLSGEYDEKLENQMEEYFSINMQNQHQPFATSLYFDSDNELKEAGLNERLKECLRTLLPYLTDEPTDDNYCILSYQCYDYSNGTNRSAATIFGLREMTEEETFQLAQKLSFTSVYENKLLEIMKAYAEKDKPADIEEFSFESDYGNVRYTNLGKANEDTLAKLQQGCEILLRHITSPYDMSNGSISFTDRYGEPYSVSIYIDWSKLTESETASLSEAFGLKFF